MNNDNPFHPESPEGRAWDSGDRSSINQPEPETPVIFRKYGPRKGGDVLALFPAELGTSDSATCSSYAHVGQHGSASPYGVIRDTRPAKPEEYADLRKELEGAPYRYRLKIYNRMQPAFDKARRDEAERLRTSRDDRQSMLKSFDTV